MKHHQPIQNFLFDLDGTLVDSLDMYVGTLVQVLHEKLGMHPDPAQLRREIIGIDSRNIMLWFVQDERLDGLVEDWAEYKKQQVHTMRLFPGVREILGKLKQSGAHVGVVTSQARVELERTRQYLQLDDLIDIWVSVDDVTAPKPAPDAIFEGLHRLGADPAASIMIGDTVVDMQSGRAAGVRVAAAGWGAPNPVALEQFHPDYWLAEPVQLLELANNGHKLHA